MGCVGPRLAWRRLGLGEVSLTRGASYHLGVLGWEISIGRAGITLAQQIGHASFCQALSRAVLPQEGWSGAMANPGGKDNLPHLLQVKCLN